MVTFLLQGIGEGQLPICTLLKLPIDELLTDEWGAFIGAKPVQFYWGWRGIFAF